MTAHHGEKRASWEPHPAAKAAVRRALDLVFPPHLLDGRGATQSTGLSHAAWAKVAFIAEPLCDGCGTPFEYAHGDRCAACQARPRAFARARAACVYDEASRELILQFKHADRLDLARLFAGWIGRAAPELIAEADAIAPIPLHPLRLLSRRYNQAAEIARPLARRHGKAYLPGALIRTRRTETQAGKSAGGRRRNVAGVFAAPEAMRRRIEGKRILLIDDVLTTGATAEACARALIKGGAAAVDLAVIARVRETPGLAI
jgi:ComF family protein